MSFAAAVVTSSDIRVERGQRHPFSGVSGVSVGRLGSRSRRPRRGWRNPTEGGLAEFRSWTAGPGQMNPRAWLLGSQMQSDRFGWAMMPAGAPGTVGTAYGNAIAGSGPGHDFGPAYVTMAFNARAAGTPAGVGIQQDVEIRTAEASRVLGDFLAENSYSGVHLVHGEDGRARGVQFDVAHPGASLNAHVNAAELARRANLSSVLVTTTGSKPYATIWFTDVPGNVQAGPGEHAVKVAGFGDEERPSPIFGAAVGAVLGGLFGGPWIAIAGGILGAFVRG